MRKRFKEAVRLESPFEVTMFVLRQPLVNRVMDRVTGREWICLNQERNPVDKHRVFREVVRVPVETPENPTFDQLTGKVKLRDSIFDRWHAEQKQEKALRES